MSTILIASVPVYGHVTPLLTAARGLVERGYTVRFLTGRNFEAAVTATGATFVPLPIEADSVDRAAVATAAGLADDAVSAAPSPMREAPTAGLARRMVKKLKAATRTRLAAYVRDSSSAWSGIAGMRYGLVGAFVWPARLQYQALLSELEEPVDAVIADPVFVGALLLAGLPRDRRPAIIGGGVIPLTLGSRHVPPFGLGLMPLRGPANLPRNAVLRFFVQRIALRRLQQRVDEIYRSIHGRPLEVFAVDWFGTTDAVAQFSVPGFEYPRPDSPVPLHFIGPPSVSAPTTFERPSWWSELDGSRPVVLVTQGTIANLDLTELVRPTLDGLAEADILVVATTGGAPVESLGPLPENARAAEFLPYDQLLPLVDVMVTNGGFGGVHYALKHGVPLVIAGSSEDKPEVAARAVWSQTGISLHTGRPSSQQIAVAVDQAVSDPRYRGAAAALAAQIGAAGGIDELASIIETHKRAGQAAR